MRLPVSYKEIVNLAKNMIKGFKDHSDIYIAPPVSHEKLKLIGWGGLGQRGSLQAPGQVRELQVTEQGKGWLYLKWKSPMDRGSPSTYKEKVCQVTVYFQHFK